MISTSVIFSHVFNKQNRTFCNITDLAEIFALAVILVVLNILFVLGMYCFFVSAFSEAHVIF